MVCALLLKQVTGLGVSISVTHFCSVGKERIWEVVFSSKPPVI